MSDTTPSETDARARAEDAARASYGRLVAWLSARTGNIAAAEDALSDAFIAALEHWPAKGVPDAPEAWLLTTARRKIIDGARKQRVRTAAEPELSRAIDEAFDEASAKLDNNMFTDDRLKLLFTCAHPAIDEGVRTPLMLQTVLGLDAARIANAFLISPATMGQRLVRAKRKIAAAAIPFETPDEEDLPPRMNAVLQAIYAAYGVGWSDLPPAAETDVDNLADEALFLARLTAKMAPNVAEAHGLLALIAYSTSRKKARRSDGGYVPFEEQDTKLWDEALTEEAEASLERAAKLKRPGRFQLEAAIQSAHAARRLKGEDTRDAVIHLYDRLLTIAPSIGAVIARAAALIAAERPQEALNALEALDPGRIKKHQPYWAVIAQARAAVGDDGANEAFERAVALTEDPAVRSYLMQRRRSI